jgi:hypothetical protein
MSNLSHHLTQIVNSDAEINKSSMRKVFIGSLGFLNIVADNENMEKPPTISLSEAENKVAEIQSLLITLQAENR